MCQGFSHFSGLLHSIVMAKLATTNIRVKLSKTNLLVGYFFIASSVLRINISN